MTKPPTVINYDTQYAKSQDAIPVIKQLVSIFKVIPEEHLLKSLKEYYAGRNGYTYKILWRTYVAMTVLNIPSFSALIRTLENNPFIALACGITNQEDIPSKFAYSRFMRKLETGYHVKLVKDIMRNLTRKCCDTLPNFAKSVAIDATDMKAWSNGSKKHKSDLDAGWVIKSGTNGKTKFVWGYKMHLMVDTTYEIPITANVTKGNTSDVRKAGALLGDARRILKFHPDYVICDAAYSSHELRKLIKRQYRAEAIIKSPKTHKKWIGDETPEWTLIFNRRVAIERVFSRMKTQRRLNNITVRQLLKVTIHSLIPVIVTQAMALAFPDTPRNCICL